VAQHAARASKLQFNTLLSAKIGAGIKRSVS